MTSAPRRSIPLPAPPARILAITFRSGIGKSWQVGSETISLRARGSTARRSTRTTVWPTSLEVEESDMTLKSRLKLLAHILVLYAICAIAIVGSIPVFAQEFPSYEYAERLKDEFRLEEVSSDHLIVHYHNIDPPNSNKFPDPLFYDGQGIRLFVHLDWQGDNAEMLTVEAPEGWIAIPIEFVVTDGQGGGKRKFAAEAIDKRNL